MESMSLVYDSGGVARINKGKVTGMVNTNQIMADMIKKSGSIETNRIEEIEEVVDYGLEKTEENIQKVALEYLEEKGFAKREDNLVRAKQHVTESSMYSDTVCVRKRREINDDLLADADEDDYARIAEAVIVDKLTQIDRKLTMISQPRYEYVVEVVDDILTDADKKQGSLAEFESFQSMLNRYSAAGWKVQSITTKESAKTKISMTGFSSTQKQVVVIFERQI